MLVSDRLGQIRLGFLFIFYGELSLRRKILEPYETTIQIETKCMDVTVIYTTRQQQPSTSHHMKFVVYGKQQPTWTIPCWASLTRTTAIRTTTTRPTPTTGNSRPAGLFTPRHFHPMAIPTQNVSTQDNFFQDNCTYRSCPSRSCSGGSSDLKSSFEENHYSFYNQHSLLGEDGYIADSKLCSALGGIWRRPYGIFIPGFASGTYWLKKWLKWLKNWLSQLYSHKYLYNLNYDIFNKKILSHKFFKVSL